MSTISSFRSIKNKLDVYRGKDWMKKCCELLREQAMKMINFKKKKKIKLLTKEKQDSYENAKICYIGNENLENKYFKDKKHCFFFYQGFFHRHWRLTGQKGKAGVQLLFHSTTCTRSRTFRHLFSTLHVRWLSHIFNRTACTYQAATRWDLPAYRKTLSS